LSHTAVAMRDLESSPLKMELIGCPETSVRNYHHSLRNNPEQRSSLWLPTLLHSVLKTEIGLCVTSHPVFRG